jgi:S-DNA-T family DNA segregation ATPase FtsK/SpoIIIE
VAKQKTTKKRASTTKSGKTTKKKSTKTTVQAPSSLNANIVFGVAALMLFFAITRIGLVGRTLFNLTRFGFGSTATGVLIVSLVVLAIYHFKRDWCVTYKKYLVGVALVGLAVAMAFQARFASLYENADVFKVVFEDLKHMQVKHFAGGGALGYALFTPTRYLLTNVGVYVIALVLFGTGGYLLASPLGEWLHSKIDFDLLEEKRRIKSEEKAAAKAEKEVAEIHLPNDDEEELETPKGIFSGMSNWLKSLMEDDDYDEDFDDDDLQVVEAEAAAIAATASPEPIIPITIGDEEFDAKETHAAYGASDVTHDSHWDQAVTPMYNPETGLYEYVQEIAVAAPIAAPAPVIPAAAPISKKPKPKRTNKAYKLPSVNLIAPQPVSNQSGEKQVVKENIRKIEETLASFGVKAQVVNANVGPSVTKYELSIGTGTRVSKVANLADDLAMALAAKDVRIEAPIPGKSLIGIETPNSIVSPVGFREMWNQSKTDMANLLEIPLGKAVDGSVRKFDLGRMPHLLVAGSTGSGKSVAVNGMIVSILMKAEPSQVKFLMVDPKMVELSVYNDIPHLLIPVVTDARKASRALQKVVDEMENRYELFAQLGVRNMAGYNAKIDEKNARGEAKYLKLPYIVVIIDELADLMMVASKEVEDSITRLGQKARAAGIHMILATQRPSTDVISGLIKANVPSKISFAVGSGTDSRVILDQNGAEKLLGRGDMLFKPIDDNHASRLQGPFLSDDDVEHVVDFIKDQAEADYDEAFDPGEVAEDDANPFAGADSGNARDPLFDRAKDLVISAQKASTNNLQRALGVGFARGDRLMAELEEAGIIGPKEGTKPRKVLVSPSGEPNGDE